MEPSSEMGSYRSTKKKGEVMCLPKYMVIHTLPEPMEVDPALAKKVAANTTLDAYWVGSQAQLNEEGKVIRLVCEWNAKDVKSIQDVLDKVPELPTDGIYPMAKLDSVDFRE